MYKAATIKWPWAGEQPEGLGNTMYFNQKEQLENNSSYYEKTVLFNYTKQHQECKEMGNWQLAVGNWKRITICKLLPNFLLLIIIFLFTVLTPELLGQTPTIYLGDDPNNPLPCACLNNATTLEDGQFRTTITIEAPTGQNWMLTLVTGLYDVNSPTPPAAPIPLGTGTIISETQAGSGVYLLNALHVDAEGFALTASNELGDQLTIDALCFYPNPQILDLADEYCETSLPFLLTGNAEGAAGTGLFFIDGNPASIFDPLALGAGDHLVEYQFDAGIATTGDPDDPGCITTVSKIVNITPAPNIITNHLVNVSLGVNCVAEIVPDMVLEGEYPCLDTDYFVTVYDADGLSLGTTVTVEQMGQILPVMVTTAAGGFSGMGSIFVTDGMEPVITDCPDDTAFGQVARDVHILNGELLNNDPSFMPQNFVCLDELVDDDNNIHFYNLETFRVTETEIYTFELSATFGQGAAGLYQGAPGSGIGGCQKLVSVSQPIPSGGGFFSGQSNIVRITAMLMPDQDYTLLTTSYQSLATGTYTWGIYSETNGQLENVPSISGTVALGIFCGNENDIFNNSASMTVLGTPTATDNCVTPTLTLSDQLTENGDCMDDVITRTFTFADQTGNDAHCVQAITLSVPTIQDVVLPTNHFFLSCNDEFLLLGNGNPSPIVSGYPFLQTAFGNIEIKPQHCNLLATYADRPRTQVCSGTYQFVRRWFLFDDCNPDDDLIFEQTIWVGDVTGPVVSCPGGNGIGQDTLIFLSDALTCSATIEAPLPEVTDDCSNWSVLTQIIEETGAIIGTIAENAPSRTISGIPVGCHRFRYTVTDDCGNATVLECPFCINDWVEPVAVCDDQLQVTLGDNGVGRLLAEDVDEGSTDNCSIDRFELRRMFAVDPNTCLPISNDLPDWAPYVDFYCCEAGTIVMVALRVVDIYGNENVCMTEVEIRDKTAPECIPPDPVTVDCSDIPPAFDPTDLSQLRILFGLPTVIDNCTNAFLEELTPLVIINDCGVGTILRRFEVTDQFGNTASICTQLITIQADPGYEIYFPADVSINCGEPVLDTARAYFNGCEQFTLTYEDVIFPPTGGACYDILRTYHVVNQCEYNGFAGPVSITRDEDCDGLQGEEPVWIIRTEGEAYVDRDNNPFNLNPIAGVKGTTCDGNSNPTGYWRTLSGTGYWTYNQRIRVFDSESPVIQFNSTEPFCSFDTETCEGDVDFPFVVTEDCRPEDLVIRVFYDAFANGTLDEELDVSAITGAYPLFNITGSFPIGSHIFVVQVEDNCGNTAESMLPFEVVDCAIDIPDCLSGLSVSLEALNPPYDIDGDGDIDIASQHIWASDFVFGEVPDCSGNVTFSINVEGVVPNIDSISLLVTCDDIGLMPIEIYFWDEAFNPYVLLPDGTLGGPNYDFCTTFITVNDDPVPFCQPLPPGGFISGAIFTEEYDMVEGVVLQSSADNSQMIETEANGQYMFDNLEMGHDYTIVPTMDGDYLNGVSTLDLLLISKHIVGVQPLDSPYKIIAADVNHSNSVTTLDLIHLHKLILNITDELSDNTSWRFVDASFDFPDPVNPWETSFPEAFSINDLDNNIDHADFVAVKIGDVNASAQTSSLDAVEDRDFAGMWLLETLDQSVMAGEEVQLSLSAKEWREVEGFQFTFEFDRTALTLENIGEGIVHRENFGQRYINEGWLTVSWYVQPGREKDSGPLFDLRFKAKKAGKLSDWLSVNSAITTAEAYNEQKEVLAIGLDFQGLNAETKNLRLHQNIPNPFLNTTQIDFYLSKPDDIILSFYSPGGRVLYQIEGYYLAGENSIEVAAKQLKETGMIYYQLKTSDTQAIRRMIVSP